MANLFFFKIHKELMRLMTYLKTKTHAATSVYASRVPIDMRSTRSFRSNRKAITAVERTGFINAGRSERNLPACQIYHRKAMKSVVESLELNSICYTMVCLKCKTRKYKLQIIIRFINMYDCIRDVINIDAE